MAGVGLEHGGAQLDLVRRLTGQGHGDQRVAGHGAGVPEAGEALGLGPLGLLDHPLDGRGPAAQPDPHGPTLSAGTERSPGRHLAGLYWMCTPEMARAMTRRWISEVPSKIV